MKKLLLLVIVLLLLSACSTTVTVVQPHGSWLGDMYFNGSYAGAIASNYDTGRWAMCTYLGDCAVGKTSGWDLVDSVGDKLLGTYHTNYVSYYFRYRGDVITSNAYRDYSSRDSVETNNITNLTISDLLK